MKKQLPLVFPILFLVAFLAALMKFSDFAWFAQTPLGNIHPWTIALTILCIFAVLTLPFLRRPAVALPLGGIAYIIGRAFFFQDPGPGKTSQWMVELLLVVIAILIANWIAHILARDYGEPTVLTAGSSYRVLQMKHALPQIELELIRCRRYNHPLSVIALVVFSATSENTPSPNRPLEALVWRGGIARVLSGMTRLSDLVIEPEEDTCFLIVLPEINHQETEQFLQRLERAVTSQLDMTIVYGIAVFPDNGHTFDAVKGKAREALNENLQSIS
jgi:hypothetical protein